MTNLKKINSEVVEKALEAMVKENPTYVPFKDDYRKDFYYYVTRYLDALNGK